MSCPYQIEARLVGYNRGHCFHLCAEICFGKINFERQHYLIIVYHRLGKAADKLRHFLYDTLDFLLLLYLKYPNLVVGFDYRHRLNEQSRSCCGCIVYKTAYLALVFGFYGYDKSSVTHCDKAFLKIFLR